MIELLNCDCMEYMKGLEDNAFDLAIVDPPYGGGDISEFIPRKKGTTAKTRHKKTTWNRRPSQKYFSELLRVSKNQIIWGANHYPEYLYSSRGWVFWDKGTENTSNFSAGELAFTSFDKLLKMVRIVHRVLPHMPLNIHPTQKPVKLYEWLLTNYSEPGQRIFDSHLGSGSIAIAAHYFGVDFVGCEIDSDYHAAAVKRFDAETAQIDLFG